MAVRTCGWLFKNTDHALESQRPLLLLSLARNAGNELLDSLLFRAGERKSMLVFLVFF